MGNEYQRPPERGRAESGTLTTVGDPQRMRGDQRLAPATPKPGAFANSQPSEADPFADSSILEGMDDLLDNDSFAISGLTVPLIGIDQFANGPLFDIDRFETSAMLRLETMETALMPVLPPPARPRRRTSELSGDKETSGRHPFWRSQPGSDADIDQQATLHMPVADATQLNEIAVDDYPTMQIPLPATRTPRLIGQRIPPPADAAQQPSPASSASSQSSGRNQRPIWESTTQQLKAIAPKVESYAVVARKLMRSSGLYAIASLGGPAISLALSPYLAHNLIASDYGVLAILNTVISLTAGITQLGLGSAFFRAYNYDYTEDRDRRAVLATATLILALIAAPVAAVAILLAPQISSLLFLGDTRYAPLVTLAAIAVLVQNLTVPAFAWLRAENRALLFSVFSLLNILTSLVATIAFVGFFQMGIAGALLAVVAGYAAVVLCMLPVVLIRSRLRVRLHVAWSMLSFGIPLVASVISVWVLQLSDRYLLEIFGTRAETASYAIAYSLGSTLSTLILAPFSLAWPTAMYSIARRRDAPRVFQTVFRWFSATLLFAAFGLSLASAVIFNVLFPVSYHSAAPVIPIVAESIAFYGVYTIVMIGANVRRKTWMTSVFTTIAALINLGLNLYLIPHYGAMGAAYSTLIAYVALAVIAYIANQRIYYIPFEVGRFLFAALVGVAIYYEIFALPTYWGAQWTMPLGVVGLLIYGAWLALLCRSAAPLLGSAQPATAIG
ncbi:MAG: polysaccharide biosynthesis C-terminal domain-containing protein [Ktedonobacterales bacterium]